MAGAREEYGITLLGVGVGSVYGDTLMERLADHADGLAESTEDSAVEDLARLIDRVRELTPSLK